MLGISVYLSEYDPEYIEQAAKVGCKIVFTSLQIPEEKTNTVKRNLQYLIKKCNELQLDMMVDISPVIFEKLGIKENDYDALSKLGIKTVRLDSGFNDFNLIKELQRHFIVVLNASLADEDYIHRAKEAGIDFSKINLTYNYYPHTDTGLSWNTFKEQNRKLSKQGLITQAFIPGDVEKRFPLYEGLPTVEEQRGMNPYVAGMQLIKEAKVNNVIVGDPKVSISTLKALKLYQDEGIVTLHCNLVKSTEHLYGRTIEIRKDEPSNLIRLGLPRKEDIPQVNALNRNRGTIIMQNKFAKRYSGEVYVIKHDLPFEARSNVIGYISLKELPLLDLITYPDKIKFISENEEYI